MGHKVHVPRHVLRIFDIAYITIKPGPAIAQIPAFYFYMGGKKNYHGDNLKFLRDIFDYLGDIFVPK